jgi:hypothetical protein
MALIPTFSRQRAIPATTGVPAPPVVTIASGMGAATQFFEQLGKEGVKLTAAQTATELAVAETHLNLKLSDLEVKLSKEDGLVAPKLFDVGAQEIFENTSLGLTTPDAYKKLKNTFMLLALKSRAKVTVAGLDRKKDQLKADMLSTNNALFRLIGTGLSPRMRSSYAERVNKNIDVAVEAGTISHVYGVKEKKRSRDIIAKNSLAFWISQKNEDLPGLLDRHDQLNTGKFTGLFAEPNAADWKNLTELEKGKILRQIFTKIQSLEQSERTNDAAKEKALKKSQEQFYGEKAIAVQAVMLGQEDIRNLPTGSDISQWLADRYIDGGHAKMLMQSLVVIAKPRTDRSEHLNLVNDIYDLADSDLSDDEIVERLKGINSHISMLSSQGRLEIVHVTQLNTLKDKIKQRNFATSPQVRARVSLRRILGETDIELQIPGYKEDPQALARIQRALNEYDARVDSDEEEPWKVHDDLLERASGQRERDIESIPRPKFSPVLAFGGPKPYNKWTLDDVAKTKFDLGDALKTKYITSTTYNFSMGYLSEIENFIRKAEILKESIQRERKWVKDEDKPTTSLKDRER